jgi:hypothetical protein
MGHVQYQNILKPALSRYRSQFLDAPNSGRDSKTWCVTDAAHVDRTRWPPAHFVFMDPFGHLPQCLSTQQYNIAMSGALQFALARPRGRLVHTWRSAAVVGHGLPASRIFKGKCSGTQATSGGSHSGAAACAPNIDQWSILCGKRSQGRLATVGLEKFQLRRHD